jgi:hypothetical protein
MFINVNKSHNIAHHPVLARIFFALPPMTGGKANGLASAVRVKAWSEMAGSISHRPGKAMNGRRGIAYDICGNRGIRMTEQRCRPFLTGLFALLLASATALGAGNVKIAIDAEFGITDSTSAQAVRHGAQVAVNEINAGGGVLGRPLEIIERDNRAIPARSLNNLRQLAADPEVVAVLCGRYSPVVVEMLPEIHRLGMLLLDPWAAADAITRQ